MLKFRSQVTRLVVAAMLAAIVCVSTLAVRIPFPGGYVHLGDTAVLLAGMLLGPGLGAAAAGIGSMLADVVAGFLQFTLATLFIKAAVAAVAAVLFAALRRHHAERVLMPVVIAGTVGEALMVGGYFVFCIYLFDSLEAALLTIPGNALQGLAGVLGTAVLLPALLRSKALSRWAQED